MMRVVSHDGTPDQGSETVANGAVLVQARFTTEGVGAGATQVASFEAAGAAINASEADFAASIVRYEATSNVKGQKYTDCYC